jgi:murein tripeptide amidase MpaA
VDIRFDTYYRNEDLNARLQFLAETHPNLLEVRELGRSFEGRPIPLCVLTNQSTGPDRDKPGFWIDGNIHATEVTASMAALHLIWTLATAYGTNDKVTALLDQRVVYVVPRLNPDGAAVALADTPRYIRSGTRPYPFAERREGLYAEDIDEDGRILQMRIEDPSGDWKACEKKPDLMVKRGPDEEGGTYYFLFSEGKIEGYDGHVIKRGQSLEGLDFNRNFPGSWRPEGDQYGAGDHPGSEPEIRAVLDFFATHSNVYGALTLHTFSRVILRPYGTRKDEEMETHDLWVYERIGERGTEITGYPCVSVYHHFKYHPKEVITGVFDDWLFDHKGIFAFTVELWDLADAAGLTHKREEKKFIEWFRKHPVEDDLKIVEYLDGVTEGHLVPWYPYDHPQLGPVELGGWNRFYSWRNPPPNLLEEEIAPHTEFAIAFASMGPRLKCRELTATPLGEDLFHVVCAVENTGFLPSYGSSQAKSKKAAHPVRIELTLPEGASLRSGRERTDLGHLEGRASKLGVLSVWYESATDHRARAEWIVHAPASGSELGVTAHGGRAGTLRQTIALG